MSCSAPKALEYVNFKDLSVNKLGFNKSTIGMVVEVHNPNNYGLQVLKTNMDIFINGNLLGQSQTDSLINIKRNSNFFVPLKFELDMQNAFKNAFNTLLGKEVLIRCTGKIKVGKGNVFMSFPIDFETKQTFSLW
jgi:LEA14-like dessication related protein